MTCYTGNAAPAETPIGVEPFPDVARQSTPATPEIRSSIVPVPTPQEGPVTREDARREVLRLICMNSKLIAQAVINDALQGKYLSAKFLFEAVGLFESEPEETEDPARRDSLASLLLKRWEVVPQTRTTEVSEVTAFVPPVVEGTVEL